MSERFHIVTDGSCDLPKELAEQNNITVVPFYVHFDDENYMREGIDIGVREFYQKMVDNKGKYPKSSMPSTMDFVDAFRPFAESGTPVVCICITSKFSGSLQSAMTARDYLWEDYPDAQITVIDSNINTVLQGIYVLEAVELRDADYSYEDAVKRLEEIKSTGRIFFTVGDLDYLTHGGRLGKVAATAVSVLGIKPLIVLKEGEIFPAGISRGRKKSTEKALDLLIDYLAKSGKSYKDFSLCIGVGYDLEEGEEFRKHSLQVLQEKGYDYQDIPVYQIGATISVHTGPYPIGFGVVEKAIHD